jgi:hypothetical protein
MAQGISEAASGQPGDGHQQGRQAQGHPEQGDADRGDDDFADEEGEEEGDDDRQGVEPVEADGVRGAAAGVITGPSPNFTKINSAAIPSRLVPRPGPGGPQTPPVFFTTPPSQNRAGGTAAPGGTR